jgi:mono/diheme cytochrome c family protein
MRTIWLVLVSLAGFTLVAYLGFHFAPAPVGAESAPTQPKAVSAEYQTIQLAHDEPSLPPGPGRAEFSAQCVICHSTRYISMQPRFPRKVWEAEVQKMVTAYKAPISEHDQAQIVNYLVATFGVEDGRK